jgi:hypothetical protein
MLSYLKALPVVLAAILVTFWLASLAFPEASRRGEIGRLRRDFLLVTMAAFLSPSIWVYVGALFVLMAFFMLRPGDRPQRAAILWALLVLAVPDVGAYLQGLGGISNFFQVNHIRVLTLGLLLPVVVGMQFGARCPHPLALVTDWWVIGYFAIQVGVVVPNATTTVVAREAFILFVDTLLPYWVFSRAFTTPDGLNSAFRAYVLAMMVMCGLAAFEATVKWPLYDAVPAIWGTYWDLSVFIERGGFLRAKASAGHSLVLGYALVIALGLWLIVKRDVKNRWLAMLGDAGFAVGILAALARGAWLGAVLLLVLLVLMGKGPIKRLLLAGLGLGMMVMLAPLVPQLATFVDLLPFIGRAESENVLYRQRLIEVSLALIAQSPWFGVPGYLNYMEDLRQGQGIIDIVNSYIAVALNTGLVGLSLFVGAFASVLWRLLGLRLRLGPSAEGSRVSVGMMATLLASMAVLATTSSIVAVVPLTYMLIGLGVSCSRVHEPVRSSALILGATR